MMYDQTRAQQPADQPRNVSGRRTSGPEALFPADEREKIRHRLGRALNTFPDTPLESLEESENALDDAIAQLMAVLAEQRRLLRAGWEGQGHHQDEAQGQGPDIQVAELHLALRRYREITQRLMSL
ncbi:hypothetical protein [Streptomyces sp. NPDC057280]|uniref:hypothetical protein n=1 Tax=Streptomyces sp. NPDC057280 TaxID=3346081 RepID=UPI0009A309C9|nr:hypothetical protein B1R27_17145 [Streptomyces sp. GKU 895]